MSISIDKSLILNKIKSSYGLKSDAEFARFLGIAPTTLSSWYKRNTMDYDLVYSKCEGLIGDFLLSGKGEIRKTPGTRVEPSQFSDTEREGYFKEIMALQKKVIQLQDEINAHTKRSASNTDADIRTMEGKLKHKV